MTILLSVLSLIAGIAISSVYWSYKIYKMQQHVDAIFIDCVNNVVAEIMNANYSNSAIDNGNSVYIKKHGEPN